MVEYSGISPERPNGLPPPPSSPPPVPSKGTFSESILSRATSAPPPSIDPAAVRSTLSPVPDKVAQKTTTEAFKHLGFLQRLIIKRLLAGKYKETTRLSSTSKVIVRDVLEKSLASINEYKKASDNCSYVSNNIGQQKYLELMAAEIAKFEQMRQSLSFENHRDLFLDPGLSARYELYSDTAAPLTHQHVVTTEDHPDPTATRIAALKERAASKQYDPAEVLDDVLRLGESLQEGTPEKLRVQLVASKLKKQVLVLTDVDKFQLDKVQKFGEPMTDTQYVDFERVLTKRLAITRYGSPKDKRQALKDIDFLKTASPKNYATVIASQRMLGGQRHQNQLIEELAGRLIRPIVATAASGPEPSANAAQFLTTTLGKIHNGNELVDKSLTYTCETTQRKNAIRFTAYRENTKELMVEYKDPHTGTGAFLGQTIKIGDLDAFLSRFKGTDFSIKELSSDK